MKKLNLKSLAILTILFTLSLIFISCEKSNEAKNGCPGIVGNFAAKSGNKQVSLSWDAPTDNGGSEITGYEVTMDNWVNKVTKTAGEKSYTFTNLTNDTEYTFKVHAINANGLGLESAQIATPKAEGENETNGPYKVGDYYNESGVKGIVFEVYNSGNNGKIVSLDEAELIWSSVDERTNATDSADGMNNMNSIKQISGWRTKYPGFNWCDSKNKDGITGWYYPSINEVQKLYYSWNSIEDALLLYSKNFTLWRYSSSTEDKADYYYILALDFETGQIGNWYKSCDFNQSSTHYGICPIRAIRKF